MVLAENMKRLERERQGFLMVGKREREREWELRKENEGLKRKMVGLQERLKELERDQRRSLKKLDKREMELSSAKLSLKKVISSASGILRSAKDAIK